MTDRKTSAPWIAGAVLLVLLGGYVGAYYGLMKPDSVSVVLDARFHISMRPVTVPVYSASWLHSFFAPIHRLDRRIRPHMWEPMS